MPRGKREVNPTRISMLLNLALQWRKLAAEGKAINLEGADNHYFGYKFAVAQWELDTICAMANILYAKVDSPLRIGNSMGELIPGSANQREIPLEVRK